MGGEIDTSDNDWKRIGIKWLVNQGVSTVLLFLILVGGGYMVYVMVPKHLDTIQAGYKEISDRHDAAVAKMADSHEKTVTRIIEAMRKDEPK